MASPAQIVRACLFDQGLVLMQPESVVLQNQPLQIGLKELPLPDSLPYVQTPDDGSLVCYVSSLPDDVDQAVLIRDSRGIIFGRQMRGRTSKHYGIQIWVRSLEPGPCYELANKVFNGIDNIPANSTTETEDGIVHYVQSVYNISDVVDFGEVPGTRRSMCMWNARVAMQDQETPLR